MNRLALETSPYLRQHADNPVDWFPWGDEAFTRARAEDRPVLLSVGYSACHWCHVMAHESFEDPDVADDINRRFVAVKVDREERPDVDAVYMDAVQATTGRGGWPMTVFLTPDGRPFFAGTYFPPTDRAGLPGLRRVLAAVDDAWRERRLEIEQQADALTRSLARQATILADLSRARPGGGDAGGVVLAERAFAELRARFDPAWGGFSPAPKFPQPTLIELCLLRHRARQDEDALHMAEWTLAAMAAGGIYDHLGGGFARYSTDATWTVPHFEKMLYDQAGLVRAYLHAWQLTGDARWRQVVDETVGYVLRDLRSPEGALYSAEDADSEGEEGRFYTWSPSELASAVGPELVDVATAWYGVTDGPNFEGRSILRRPPGAPLQRPTDIELARRRLFDARARRVRPALDDKVLTEWNAMFASALAEAAAATGDSRWAQATVDIAQFLLDHLRREDGRWMRSWQEGTGRHLAYAADHAWVVDAFTRVAELTGEGRWLDHASSSARSLLALFRDAEGVLRTTGSDADALIVRPVDVLDDATPSANSVAAGALLRLGALTGDDLFTDAGQSLVGVLNGVAGASPLAAAHGLAVAALGGGGVTEVVITGDRPDLLDALRRRFEPTVVVAWGEPTPSPLWAGRGDGKAYVCRRFACRSPASSVAELERALDAELVADRERVDAESGA